MPIPRSTALALPKPVRISNAEAHADMYNTTSPTFVGALAVINIPRRHLPLLCFDWFLEFARFWIAKDKTSSKRLSHYVYRPPTNPVGASDVTKVAIICDNSRMFVKICVKKTATPKWSGCIVIISHSQFVSCNWRINLLPSIATILLDWAVPCANARAYRSRSCR